MQCGIHDGVLQNHPSGWTRCRRIRAQPQAFGVRMIREIRDATEHKVRCIQNPGATLVEGSLSATEVSNRIDCIQCAGLLWLIAAACRFEAGAVCAEVGL